MILDKEITPPAKKIIRNKKSTFPDKAPGSFAYHIGLLSVTYIGKKQINPCKANIAN
ncbi:MAG: hypothetical protein ACOC4R_01200 [Bacteroidota bacterium]